MRRRQHPNQNILINTLILQETRNSSAIENIVTTQDNTSCTDLRRTPVMLADLYDPDTMPPNLVASHQILGRAVDAAYRADGSARS